MADKGTPTGREKNTFQPSRHSEPRKRKRKLSSSRPKKEEKTVKLPGDFEDDVMGAIIGGVVGFVIGMISYWRGYNVRLFGFSAHVSELLLFPGDVILLFTLLGILIGYMYRRSVSAHHDWFGSRDW